MATQDEIQAYLSGLDSPMPEDPDDPQGSYLAPVQRAIETTASHFDRGYANRAQQAISDYQAVENFANDPRNRYPNPYMAGYEQRAAQDAEYQRRNRAQQAYDEYMDPNALQKYAEKHPEFAQAYGELQDYRRKGYDVEDQLNFEIEKAPMVQRVINQQEANRYTPYEQGREADAQYYASLPPGYEANNYDTGSFSKIPQDFRRSQRQWVGDDNLKEAQLYAQDARKRDGREEAAWGQMQENRLAAANETLPGEVGRDSVTESLWKAKDRLAAQHQKELGKANEMLPSEMGRSGEFIRSNTKGGEFGTTQLNPSSGSLSFLGIPDPAQRANKISSVLFGDPIQPNGVQKSAINLDPQMGRLATPEMAAQQQQQNMANMIVVQGLTMANDPRLMPGNPEFNPFVFADYVIGLRERYNMQRAQYETQQAGRPVGQQPVGGQSQQPQVDTTLLGSKTKYAWTPEKIKEATSLGFTVGMLNGVITIQDKKTGKTFTNLEEAKASIMGPVDKKDIVAAAS